MARAMADGDDDDDGCDSFALVLVLSSEDSWVRVGVRVSGNQSSS